MHIVRLTVTTLYMSNARKHANTGLGLSNLDPKALEVISQIRVSRPTIGNFLK